MAQNCKLQEISSQIRRDIIRMVHLAASGHPGGSLSSVEILTTLFFEEMDHSPQRWRRDGVGSDLFFLSAGHMTPLYYSILARSGYFPIEELNTFRKLGSRLQGHPAVDQGLPGVHVASGSLGQGLSVAAGAALAKRINGEDKFIYTLIGDGESEEGQIWEAALFAAHHKLGRLIAITDWNGQQIDGPIDEVLGVGDLESKWRAFGWRCRVVDGHDFDSIREAFKWAKEGESHSQPVMLLMKSEMGRGVDFMEGTHHWHGKAPNQEECKEALLQLEETLGDF